MKKRYKGIIEVDNCKDHKEAEKAAYALLGLQLDGQLRTITKIIEVCQDCYQDKPNCDCRMATDFETWRGGDAIM